MRAGILITAVIWAAIIAAYVLAFD